MSCHRQLTTLPISYLLLLPTRVPPFSLSFLSLVSMSYVSSILQFINHSPGLLLGAIILPTSLLPSPSLQSRLAQAPLANDGHTSYLPTHFFIIEYANNVFVVSHRPSCHPSHVSVHSRLSGVLLLRHDTTSPSIVHRLRLTLHILLL
jgi:hypothetical protein